MNAETLTLLDQQELLQIALQASGERNSALVLACLKEAVRRSDATAHAHYLLGAEYAGLQLFPRAMGAMEDALALDPTLWTARLQLALLYLDAGRNDAAIQVLEPLLSREAEDGLRMYARGLTQLAGGDPAAARASLQDGIAQDKPDAPLARDMQRLCDELAKQLPEAEQGSHDLMLSAYAGTPRY